MNLTHCEKVKSKEQLIPWGAHSLTEKHTYWLFIKWRKPTNLRNTSCPLACETSLYGFCPLPVSRYILAFLKNWSYEIFWWNKEIVWLSCPFISVVAFLHAKPQLDLHYGKTEQGICTCLQRSLFPSLFTGAMSLSLVKVESYASI